MYLWCKNRELCLFHVSLRSEAHFGPFQKFSVLPEDENHSFPTAFAGSVSWAVRRQQWRETLRCDSPGETLGTPHSKGGSTGGGEIAQGQAWQAGSCSATHPKYWWLEAIQVVDTGSHHVNDWEGYSVISFLFILIFVFCGHCNVSDRDPASMNKSLQPFTCPH